MKVADALVLDDDETIKYEFEKKIPRFGILAAIILSFIPPFIWGLLALGAMYWYSKRADKRVLLTNKRIISRGVGGDQIFQLDDVKKIFVSSPGLLRPNEIAVSIEGKKLPRYIRSIKNPYKFTKAAQDLIK